MCDIESQRKKIDSLIEQRVSPFWFEDDRNRRALVEIACKCVHDDYCDQCSLECIRARCETYVALRLGRIAA
jgi:hypothetical protein